MVFNQPITLKIVRFFIKKIVKFSYRLKNSNFQVQLIGNKNKTHRFVH